MAPIAAKATATRVWGLLVLATLGSFGIAELLHNRLATILAIVAVALFKAQLILRHYMELRVGPVSARAIFLSWAAGCAVVISGLAVYTLS